MKKKILLVPVALLLAISLVAVGCPSPPAPLLREIVVIEQWSAPFGTPNYVVAHALEDISKKHHPWLRVAARETLGFVFNMVELDRSPLVWERVIMQQSMNMLWLGDRGEAPFFKEPIKGRYKNLANWLAFGPQEGGLVIVTFDPNLKDIGDFVGKSIALGLRTQNNYGHFPYMIIDKGWGLADQIDVKFVGLMAGKDMLLDGMVDGVITFRAVVTEEGVPVELAPAVEPGLIEILATGRPVYYVSFGREQIEKVVAEYGVPLFSTVMSAEVLPDQDWDVEPLGMDVGFWVEESFPEELAYEYTKFYWENLHRLPEYAAWMGLLMTQEVATTGVPKEMYHPGAIRFYEEVGAVWR